MSNIVKNPAYGFTVLLVVSTRKVMPNTQKSWNTLTFDPMEKRTAMNLAQKCFWKTWKTREWRKQLIQRTFSPTMSHGHTKVTVVLSQIQSYFVRVCFMPFTQCSWIAFFKRITRLILQDSCYSLLHSLFFFFCLFVFFVILFCCFSFFFFHWFAVKNKFAIAFVSLVDWLGNLAPYSQPIRGKNKTNYDWFARVFPPWTLASRILFALWLALPTSFVFLIGQSCLYIFYCVLRYWSIHRRAQEIHRSALQRFWK